MSRPVQSQEMSNATPPNVLDAFRNYLDIPLQVIIELGSTRLKIRDLLALEPGSVIMLSQAIGADLSVNVNNVCIGRGLVIPLDDRACVRITELVTEQ